MAKRAKRVNIPKDEQMSAPEPKVEEVSAETVEPTTVEKADAADDVAAEAEDVIAAAEAAADAEAEAEEAADATPAKKQKKKQAPVVKTVFLDVNDRKHLKAILLVQGEKEVEYDAQIDFAEIPKETRNQLRNLDSRGLIDLVTNEEEGDRIMSVALTYKGWASFSMPKQKAEKLEATTSTAAEKKTKSAEPKKRGAKLGRYSDADFRIKVIAQENPRRIGTHGYNSFELYVDGMTYAEYLQAGGSNNHFEWDLGHGYIAIYDVTKKEEDSDYWVTKNRMAVPPVASVADKSVKKDLPAVLKMTPAEAIAHSEAVIAAALAKIEEEAETEEEEAEEEEV